MKDNIHYSFLNPNDTSQVIELAEQLFGKGFMTLEELNTYLNSTSRKCLIAKYKKDVVAFHLFTFTSQLKDIALHQEAWFRSRYQNKGSIGLIKTIAVNEKYTGKGIGRNLITKAITLLSKKSDAIISVCWIRENNTPLPFLLSKLGFSKVNEFSDFWKEDSLIKKYNCIACGKPPCLCVAHIYESKQIQNQDLLY